jgi:hypothetical protein
MNRDVVYQASGEGYRLDVMYDELMESPREQDNLGTMVCFHDRYTLGDKHEYKSIEEFFRSLFDDCGDDELLGNDGFMSGLFYYWKSELRARDSEEGLAVRALDCLEKEMHPQIADAFPAAKLGRMVAEFDWGWVEDFIDAALDTSELQDILDDLGKYVILPLYLYDHGGITMSIGPFSCPWDSGQVGWIYAPKQKFIEETGYTKAELFSTDSKRDPAIGERVKIKGRGGWGQVVSKAISSTAGTARYEVDFDWDKIPDAHWFGNLVTVPQDEILEVMSNRAAEMLVNEVKTYDAYLRGESYGYRLSKLNTCEHCGAVDEEEIDSCWGFLAKDFADLKEQLKSQISGEHHDLVDSLGCR